MTLVPPSTNNVYICQFPPTLTRWTGHVTVPIRKKKMSCYTRFPSHHGTVQLEDVQPGQLVSPVLGPQVHPFCPGC